MAAINLPASFLPILSVRPYTTVPAFLLVAPAHGVYSDVYVRSETVVSVYAITDTVRIITRELEFYVRYDSYIDAGVAVQVYHRQLCGTHSSLDALPLPIEIDLKRA
jgi:hypothetical protein